MSRFDELYEQIVEGRIDEPSLARLEKIDDIFPDLDASLYAT